MLIGSADPEALARHAPTLLDFSTDAVTLEEVEILQLLYEFASGPECALLPPALHPTVPPVMSVLVHSVPESPWGAFRIAQARIECRSGLRPRGFPVGAFVDGHEAGRELSARWGYGLRPGRIELSHRYDETRARVSVEGGMILDAGHRNPLALGPDDVQYVANMNLARTPNGLRLVQVDPDHEVRRSERGTPFLDCFDAGVWGDARIVPVHPIASSYTVARFTLPKLRYVCRPDVLAFEGTEKVSG